MRGASSSNCYHNETKDIPASLSNIFKKWNIFLNFLLYFLVQKSNICIGEFYKYYCDV